ncbi:MAG: hypothetical protein HY824_14600 [Acidobacteria bacterium]|nr:hypothetical protein [Acidobacteriota bacterium]
MTARLHALLLAGALACAPSASAQTPPADGITALLDRLQTLLQDGNAGDLGSLLSPAFPADDLAPFSEYLFQPDTRRAIVAERDRAPLAGALPGDGYRLVTELYTETPLRARIVTALVDVRRPAGDAADSWRIVGAQAVTSIDGLFRLRVNASTQFTARNLTVTAEDLRVTLSDGSVFLIESEAGVTGLVLLGRGVMHFAPGPETERGQLRIFSGSDTLDTPFESAFVRLNPFEYEARVTTASLTPAAVNPRDLRRAQDVLARDGPKSFSLDLRDLSSDVWYLLPPSGDFLAEVRTRRYGTLTYLRSATQAEDITVFDRDDRHTIALYPSAQRRVGHGLSFNEDDRRDYDVLDYDIEANVSPDTAFIDGRVRMRIRMQSADVSSLTLRLADELAVRSIGSVEYGRLLYLRVRDQNNVIVNFPVALRRGAELTLLVTYAGRVTPQDISDEGVQEGESRPNEPLLTIPPEPNLLLSSRTFWYPQNPVTDYATGTLRIILPEGYGCAASGQLRADDDVTLRDLLTLTEGRSFVFSARDPVRYFAVVVSKFARVADRTIEVAPDRNNPTASRTLRIAVEANPRQQRLGRGLVDTLDAMMRFYADLAGDVPYGSMTMALVEDELPGGHSPAYMAVLNNQMPTSRLTWRGDPAAFSGFPEFFAAHELAHQWWGQAVGWRNYHEQWLSEGFAQYFAALYAQHARGERTFVDMLRQFRRWAIAESDQGPIALGSRLGHIRDERRVFRALVYNKGAAVLHMLRRLVGDEHFFNGMRRFYREQKFRKAGTDDLRAVFEAESGRPLDRFFDRWIYGVDIPRLRYTATVAPGRVGVRFTQIGDQLFDVPVTVTVVYADGRAEDSVVSVTEQRVDWTLPTRAPVRRVLVNRDFAAVAVFERY